MQVTETSAEGLKRELKVVVGAGELGERFASRLNEIKDRVQLKGFRPGKVPVAHIKRVYGRSMMAEVVQQAVSETSQKALEERQERPAFRPDIKFSEDTAEIERVLGGEADLAYSMSFEVLPKVEIADLSKVAIERPVATVGDAQVDKTLGDMIESNVRFEPVEGRAATDGDRVSVDFTGKIDGTPFEGGVGEAVNVVIGKGGFIPGFEEGLVGAKAGDSRVVTATFPEAYPVKELAGKAAEFDVTVKSVDKPVKSRLDDDFAKQLGFEDLGKLREAVSHDLERDFARASRMKAKRALLDVLDAQHAFALPPTLVENEFEQMWREVNEGLQRAGRTFEDEGKTEAGERESYRKLAERRVRLGLVLSEIGQANKITVSDEELSRALSDQVRRFPGQEAEVYSFYRKNPQALAQLRAPIYEEKVVTFILEMAKVTDKTVSAEELFAGDDDEDEHAGHDHHGHAHHHHDHDHAHDHDHDHDHAHDHDHGHAHGHGHEHRK